MKFKVGDYVIGNRKANFYVFTIEGSILKVVRVGSEGFAGILIYHPKGSKYVGAVYDNLNYDYFDKISLKEAYSFLL